MHLLPGGPAGPEVPGLGDLLVLEAGVASEVGLKVLKGCLFLGMPAAARVSYACNEERGSEANDLVSRDHLFLRLAEADRSWGLSNLAQRTLAEAYCVESQPTN